VNLKNSVGRATFYVKPSMTKHEVKEYLTKIYGMEVYKVETANFLGMLFVCVCVCLRVEDCKCVSVSVNE
jgi:hypothetical protein